MFFVDGFGGRGAVEVDAQAVGCELLLFWGEEFGGPGGVGKEEVGDGCYDDCDGAWLRKTLSASEYLLWSGAVFDLLLTFHKEDPRPTIIPVVVDLRQTRSQKTSKRSRQRRSAVEDSKPKHDLVALVEHAEVKDNAAEETTLARTQK